MVNIEWQIENKLAELGKYVYSKKIVLFGAGIYSKRLYRILIKRGYSIHAVIDNNQSLAGHILEKTTIQYAETFLKEFNDNYIFLILSRSYYEMKNQLEKNRYVENIHFFQMAVIDMIDDWHFVDENQLNKCILNIERGRNIHKRLAEKYGEKAVFLVNPVASIGDIYLMSFYVKAYVKKNHESIFVFGSRVLEELANQLNFRHIVFMDLNNVHALIDYAKVFGFEKVNIKLLHTGYIHFRLWSRMLTYTGITWMEHYRELFELPDYSKIDVTELVPSSRCGKIFTEYGLIPGKTVILSPYANTIRQVTVEFWELLATQLLSMGYSVCTNIGSSREKPIFGTIPVFIEINNISEFVEIAGFFIGIRSGLCDLLCCCKCLKIILYSDEIFDLISVYDFYSLKKMGFGKNVLEYVVNQGSERKILEDILLIMKRETELEERRLAFKNLIQDGDTFWFWEECYNGLFYCGYDKKYAVRVELKRKQNLLKGSLYSKIILYRGKIICVPYMADNILIYEITDKKERYIEIDGIYKFLEYVIDGRYVFLLGYGSSVILKFDMIREMVINYIDIYAGIQNEKNRIYFESGLIYNSRLFVPDYWEYFVYEIDVDTMCFAKHKIQMLSNTRPNVYINNKRDEICFPPDNMESAIMWNREHREKELFLFPSRTQNEEVLIFNPENNLFYIQKFSLKQSFENFYKDKTTKNRLYELFFLTQVCNGFLYVLDETKNLYMYYPEEDILMEKMFYSSRTDYIDYKKLQLPHDVDKYQVIYEKFYSISDYVRYMKDLLRDRQIENVRNRSLGSRILKALE